VVLLQGALIFILHVGRSREVRLGMQVYFRCVYTLHCTVAQVYTGDIDAIQYTYNIMCLHMQCIMGRWKRWIWSDADTDVDRDKDNFNVHFTFTQHLFFIPNVVFTVVNPGMSILS